MSSWLWKNFGYVATIIGFVADSITLYLLFFSNRTPNQPFISYPISIIAQLTIWSIATIAYFAILREYWIRIYRRIHMSPGETFGNFVIRIIKFEIPWFLIPFAFLIGTLLIIFVQMGRLFGCILMVVALALAAWLFKSYRDYTEDEEWEAIDDDDVYNLWVTRIDKELAEVGFATSYDLARLYSERRSICDKVLRTYFSQFQSQNDLILFSDIVRTKENTLDSLVVARRVLAHSKPWRSDSRR